MFRRRNRRKKTKVVPFPATLAGILFIVLMWCGASIWIDDRCSDLKREIRELERQKKELERRYNAAECRWMRLKSPGELEQTLARHRVNMSWPSGDQIVRLSEPSSSGAAGGEADEEVVTFARIERLIGYE